MAVKRGKLPPTPGDTYKQKLDLELSDDWNEPELDLNAHPIVIYGEQGVGKTTLAKQFENPFFLFTEKGGRTFRFKGAVCEDWEEFAHYSSEIQRRIRKDKWDYSPIVIDSLDRMGKFAHTYVCKTLGIKSPHELSHGRAWDLISVELKDYFEPLIDTGYGFIGMSHSALRTVQRADGSEFNRIEPTYDNRVGLLLSGPVALTGYYYHEKGGRFLRIVGNELITAKCRFHEDGVGFIAKNGRPVKIIDMGQDSKEAYQNLIAAFNGEQATSGEKKSQIDVLPVETKKHRKRL